MSCFWTGFLLKIKSTLRSKGFWCFAVAYLLLAGVLGGTLSEKIGGGFRIGVVADGELKAQMEPLLSANGDYEFEFCQTQEALEQGILSERYHCGYVLDETEQPPLRCIQTKASYMAPLVDEIVLAAYLRATTPQVSKAFLEARGLESEGIESVFQRVSLEAPGMEVEVVGEQALQKVESAGMSPLAYALLACVFPTIALTRNLLSSEEKRDALFLLGKLSGRRFSVWAAPVLGDVVLAFCVLTGGDLLLSQILGHMSLYPLPKRFMAYLVLALITGGLKLLRPKRKEMRMVLLALLPLWLWTGVLCSGGVVSPELLPSWLGVLRWISPGWYFLQIAQF